MKIEYTYTHIIYNLTQTNITHTHTHTHVNVYNTIIIIYPCAQARACPFVRLLETSVQLVFIMTDKSPHKRLILLRCRNFRRKKALGEWKKESKKKINKYLFVCAVYVYCRAITEVLWCTINSVYVCRNKTRKVFMWTFDTLIFCRRLLCAAFFKTIQDCRL